MFRIGEFSKMGRATIKTLRFYDEAGLLKPEATDKFTGYRLYTTGQLVTLHKIQSLRQTGLSIDEIKMILSGRNTSEILSKRKNELISELAEIGDQISRIEFILQGKEEDFLMSYNATIKQIPECIIYSRKIIVASPDDYFKVIPETGEKVSKKYPDLKCPSPEYCFIAYPDNESRETNITIEFCEAVDKIMPDFDDITFRALEAVTVVSVLHKGAYEKLPEAYVYITKWIEDNGYTITGSLRENHIDGIWNKDNEDEWLTEIQFPVEKK